jgi:hypothetical protein
VTTSSAEAFTLNDTFVVLDFVGSDFREILSWNWKVVSAVTAGAMMVADGEAAFCMLTVGEAGDTLVHS